MTKLVLDKICEKDIDILFQLQQKPQIRAFFIDKAIPSWEQHVKWFSRFIKDPMAYGYIIRMDNKCAGVVRLNVTKTNLQAEISIIISPDFWGQGIAYTALLDCFSKGKFHEYLATVHKDNKRSLKLFLKLGFSIYHVNQNFYIMKLNLSKD